MNKMAEQFLPRRTLSFADRLQMASMGSDEYNARMYKQYKRHSLYRQYAQLLLQEAQIQNTQETDIDECPNELGIKSPVRKKDKLG
jgi:hypothetical protein